MAVRKKYVKARIIDPNEDKFGKVVDVYRLEDTRFFANRYGVKYGDRAYFSDQLNFTPFDPIPVMYSIYGDERGPWELGFIHQTDIITIHEKNGWVNTYDSEVPVFQMDNGIPSLPKLVRPLEKFKAPAWRPSWKWSEYSENREKKKK